MSAPVGNSAARPRHYGRFFFRKFLRDPKEVAAIWPSSAQLARAMLRGAELQPGDAVVELGPGTGSFTSQLVPLLDRTVGARYLGIDRDPEFLGVVRERFPQLEFVQQDALNLPDLLAARPELKVRLIVSGLPIVAMPKPLVERMLATIEGALQPGGSFRTFSYLHTVVNPASWWLRRRMRQTFASFAVRGPVIRNLPPALIFEAFK